MELLTGLLLGLSTLLFIGPVFFYLLKSTLESSIKAGLAVAVGIIVGDIIYVILVLKGLSAVFASEANQQWLALAGGIILLLLGLSYIIKPKTTLSHTPKANSLWRYAANGFLLNFINPFVIGVWILFYGINEAKFESEASIITSLTITLVVIFVTDCLKVRFAHELKKFMNPSRLKQLFQLFGVIMILFGFRLLYTYFRAI